MAFAKGLIALGVPARSIVLLQGYNSPEHFAALIGSTLANCISCDIYLTNSPEICLF